MWKFYVYTITQILREINFRDSRSAKTAVFAIFGAVNFFHLGNFSLQKVQNSEKSKFRASKCVKKAVFGRPKFLKMILRKT